MKSEISGKTDVASISAAELQSEMAGLHPPIVIDVRRRGAFIEASRMLAGALRRDPDDVTDWTKSLPAANAFIVYCVHGGEVSQRVANGLMEHGIFARFLERGIDGWAAANGSMDGKPRGASTRWVTRERPKIDRIACPWLIARFVDPDAEFLHVPTQQVPTTAREKDAIPYDIPDVHFSHDGERCSFDAFLAHYGLQDPALEQLALIVRGADTARLELAPQAPGLAAISLGLSRNYADDHEMLGHGMVMYDALYRWCKEGRTRSTRGIPGVWHAPRRGGGMNNFHGLVAGLIVAFVVAGAAAAAPVLELVSTIAMPGVKGRIDHFSLDPKTHRIFVAALGNGTVEVVDTQHNGRQSIAGMREPQGVLYVPDANRLFVANGEGGRVDIVDGTSLRLLKRIEGMDDADNVRYDARTGKILVGFGRGALRILDPESGESNGDIPLPGHPESFQLEQGGERVFVNVPSARSVVVVDRARRETIANWETAGAGANFPMALDEDGSRLFVGARTPPELLVYDTKSGKIAARVPIGKDTDDLYFDARRKRLYVICGEGKVDVIRQETPERYTLEASIKTAPRARTGLFVPDDRMLYVAAPASGSSPARVLVYHVD